MTKSEHTSGPWGYNPESPNRVTGPRGETISATYGGMVGYQEQFANTRLIANAPVMLDYVVGRARDGDQGAKTILESMGLGD
ncbi:MAG: hypothetical protein QGF12_03950 [SAR202 cluster bacterium]|nr:hypothetical protein [SAR202 cluster bacterium]